MNSATYVPLMFLDLRAVTLGGIRAITLERVFPVTNPGASIEDSVRCTRRPSARAASGDRPQRAGGRSAHQQRARGTSGRGPRRVRPAGAAKKGRRAGGRSVPADRRSGGGRVSGRTKACGTMRVARRGRALCRREGATRRGHTPGAQGSRRRELVDGLSEGVATWTDQAPAGSDPAPNRRSVRIERRTEGVAQLRFLERDDEPLKVGERQRQEKRRPQLVQQACLSEVGE